MPAVAARPAGRRAASHYRMTGEPEMDLRETLADTVKGALTTAIVPIQRRRAAALARRRPLRLHLGSADSRLDRWVNVDLFRPGRRLDLYWDLRRGIPFADGCVDAIFAEHLLEHLTLDDGIGLLRECRRVLAPGGVVRIGVPDLERYVASYLKRDDLIDVVRPGRPTRAIALGEPFFLHGHRTMYDFETLRYALTQSGFGEVERSEFGGGRIDPSPDSPGRRAETLYVEATT
jgi:predicted SAM-dependent methyltransferase